MNFGNTSHALIYPESDSTNKKSAFIFNRHIISSGTILINLIQRKKLQKRVEKTLIDKKLVGVNENLWTDLTNEIFVITHESERNLVRRKARLKHFFNSQNIFDSIKDILTGFRSYKVPFDQVTFHQLLVSSFVILEFCDDKTAQGNEKSLLDAMTEDAQLNECLNKLDTVVCVTTPFAHESFFKTVNVSKVANIFGVNNCMLIITAPLVYGCEGGSVYDINK